MEISHCSTKKEKSLEIDLDKRVTRDGSLLLHGDPATGHVLIFNFIRLAIGIDQLEKCIVEKRAFFK